MRSYRIEKKKGRRGKNRNSNRRKKNGRAKISRTVKAGRRVSENTVVRYLILG